MSPERTKAKMFYDMNQNVKNIFNRYIVLQDGFIYGEVNKANAEHGVYRNDRITMMVPECENMMVQSQDVYDINKMGTVQNISEEGGMLYLHNADGKFVVGGEISEGVKNAINKKMRSLIDELMGVMKNPSAERLITTTEYKALIEYNKLLIDFPGYPDCSMMLTISVFPIPKKLKMITAYLRNSNGETFDVVFHMRGTHEDFTFIRKFLKIDSEAVVVEGL